MDSLSRTQLEVILKLSDPASPGVLERWPGGFWTTPGMERKEHGWPVWSTTVQTVQALERKGLLRRMFIYPEEWRDDRQLTEAWLDLALGGLEPNKKSAQALEAERMYASGFRSTGRQKVSQIREKLAALEAEKRAEYAEISSFARRARARTVIEPTTRVRGSDCQVVGEDRQRALRAEVDAFYEALRRDVAARIEPEQDRLREEIERTRDIVAIQTKTERRASSAIRRLKQSEAVAESDFDVESNIDPDLMIVWKAVMRGIKGSPKMSRTEAFLHWVEENPDEVTAILADKLEQSDAEMARAQYAAAELEEEVPF